MKKIGSSLACALSLLAGSAQAAKDEGWSVWVEQDGNKLPFQNEVHLKKKPFTLVFQGKKGFSYCLTGAVTESDLAGRKTKEQVAPILNPGLIIAEKRNGEGTLLAVNNAGAIAAEESVAQNWSLDESSHSNDFQQYSVNAGAIATARRDVGRIFFNTNFDVRGNLPVADFPKNKIYVLISRVTEDGELEDAAPKLASIAFEPEPARELAAHSYTAATSASAGVSKGVAAYYAHDYAGAAKALQPYAELGDPVAEYYLGNIYADAGFAAHDDIKAVRLLYRAKERGFDLAADRFNVLLKENRTDRTPGAYDLKDDEKAVLQQLRAKAGQGDVSAMERLAVAYCFSPRLVPGGQTAEAAAWLRKAAEGGEPRAQYQMGMHALRGTACGGAGSKDIAQGVNWLRKAAAQGLVAAQLALAAHDKQAGDGLKNPGEGLRWLKLALEQNDARAYAMMGDYLEDGWNVEQNWTDMRRWLEKAAALGVGEAMEMLAAKSEAFHDNKKDYPDAVKWRTQAIEAGHWQSARNLALMYEAGHGVAKNQAQAIALLQLAARVDSEALYLLSVRAEYGRGLVKNRGQALSLLVRAAEMGNGHALESLAGQFAEGKSLLDKNPAMAYVLYSLAAAHGQGESLARRDALGAQLTPADSKEAREFLEKWTDGMQFAELPLFQKLVNSNGATAGTRQ